MGYSAKVGSFNIDTAKTVTQQIAVTGLGFQPKIVLFWWGGSTATGDEVAGGLVNIGFGAAIDATHRVCVYGVSQDGAATSNTGSGHNTSACMRGYSDADTLDGRLDFVSMDADGFTTVIDDQFTIAFRISYLALGGSDLTNVYIATKQLATSTGNQAVTGIGFKPDAVLFAMPYSAGANEYNPGFYFSLGMATGPSNQGYVHGYSQDNSANSITYGYGFNGECIGRGDNYRESFVSLDADGFTLNHLEGTLGCYYYAICLKGGQYKVGDILTRTDGNDIAETEPGFQPVALLFASANKALSTQETMTAHARFSIGAATGAANRACAASSDESGLADTETAHANYDTEVYANVVDDGVVGLMDIKSIDATGFTAVMDDTDPSACWVTYLAIGATPTTPTITGRKTLLGVGI
jgi:hypothetical protein